jgi:ribosomal protein S17
MTGVVTSNKMEKSVVVEVTRTYRHKLYKKVVHSRKRVMAHDELGCEIGDHVRIVESRPSPAASAGWWKKSCAAISPPAKPCRRLNHDPAGISFESCR